MFNSYHLKYLSVIVLSITTLISCEVKPEIRYDVALHNVELIDLETGRIQQMDLYLKDGRIARLETTSPNLNAKAKQTIDATGKYALPGFWDNHVHFRGGDSLVAANKDFLKLFLANGITTVRDAGGDLTTDVLEWNKAIKNGALDGPTIFTSGPKIDGPNATWAGSLEVENELTIQNALDSLEKIPVDFVKLYDSQISAENYLNTIEMAEERGMITSGHMPFTVTLDETIEAGIDAIEHLYYVMKGSSSDEKAITKKLRNKEIGFWEAMPLLQNSYADNTALNIFQKLKSSNVFVVPTLHIGHTLSYLDKEDHTTDPYLKYMPPGIIQTYQGRINNAKRASKKAIADRKKLDTFFQGLTASLHNNGVSILAGSDSGAFNSYTYPGVSLHQELEALVATGIPPLDALRTSAFNGAKFLKKDQEYGSISEGKMADIVLLNTNPLMDIKNTTDIYMVISHGEVHNQEALNQILN